MNKCEKCGTNFNDDCVVVWKCSECGKAFKISYSKLQRMQEWKNKNIGKHLLKCTDCGSVLDDGNEKIVCKCSSCGNVNDGNLAYFVSDDNTNNAEIDSSNFYPDLIECPECGKKILSDSKICSYCGFQLGEIEENEGSIKCPECNKEILKDVDECPFCGYPMKTRKGIGLWSKNNGRSFKKNVKRISVIIFGIIAIIILSLVIKSCAECEHEYDLGVITKPSTCTEEGEKTYTCSLCGETKVENVPVIKHEYSKEKITKQSTCVEEGEKTLTCENCGVTKTESIPKKVHSYQEEITKESTFDEEGIKTFTCKECGNTYTETIPVIKDKVIVTVKDKYNLDIDYDANRYSPWVNFTFEVYNNTNKDIKGVQGELHIKDLFGKEFTSGYMDFVGQTIKAKESVTYENMGYDLNQFVEEHMKLFYTDYEDLIFEYKVTSIVYTDGTEE